MAGNLIDIYGRLVAAGEFDAAVSLGWKNDWDLAAADLIAREAGTSILLASMMK